MQKHASIPRSWYYSRKRKLNIYGNIFNLYVIIHITNETYALVNHFIQQLPTIMPQILIKSLNLQIQSRLLHPQKKYVLIPVVPPPLNIIIYISFIILVRAIKQEDNL